MKLKLNNCKCGKTYNTKEVNATSELCSTFNEKQRSKTREKDALRKSLSRKDNDSPCDNLEKLGDLE